MKNLGWAGWLACSLVGLGSEADPPASIRGRVVGPDGRPVAGARVIVRPAGGGLAAGPTVVSGGDGRFQVSPPPDPQGPPTARARAILTATAPGSGVGWTAVGSGGGEAEVRLEAQGPPIEGRVVDAAGRPVGGAKVVVRALLIPRLGPDGDTPAAALDRFLATPEGRVMPGRLERVEVALLALTAGNGRFALRGVGLDRIARIEVSGAAIATTEVDAMTRGGPVPRLIRETRFGWQDYPLRPDHFDLEVEPARIIAGTARDAETGEPLAGWKVTASFARLDSQEEAQAEAATDSAGRYRLAGLAPSSSYAVRFRPPRGQPYLAASVVVSSAPRPGQLADFGAAPAPFDVSFRRAAVIRGRVTDRATGRPVAGAVAVVPYPGDPANADYPEFGIDGAAPWRVDADGSYAVVAPPGRTVLAFEADPVDRYKVGQGADLLPVGNPGGRGAALTSTRRTSDFNVLAPVEIDPADRAARLDLEVEVEEFVELTVLDPAGEPLGDVEVQGVGARSLGRVQHVAAARFDLLGFTPGHWRRVSAWHLGRKLAGSTVVSTADGPRRTIRLAPWGEARARVVGPDGAPRGDLALVAGPVFSRDPRPEPFASLALIPVPDQLRTDPAGRLHLAGLIPGTHYGLSIRESGDHRDGDLFTDLTVGAGAVLDLGDRAVPPRPIAPPR